MESPVLVRMTVRRIRVAQAMLGYPLLPLANVSSMDSAMADMNGELAETEGSSAYAWEGEGQGQPGVGCDFCFASSSYCHNRLAA